ncbi:MAG: helix-turn-helix domain-containing protein [Polyangiales bacterium]
MRTTRLLSILGPTAVLYIIAARASLHVSSPYAWGLGLGSLLLALSPVLLILGPPPRAGGRLAALGVVLAVAVVSSGIEISIFQWVYGFAWVVAAQITLDLVLPRSFRTSARAAIVAGVVTTVLGLVAATPIPPLACGIASAVLMVAAGALHFVRLRRRGHALEGSLAALGFILLATALAAMQAVPVDPALAASGEFSIATLLWMGHLAWIDPQRRGLRRNGVAFVAACLIVFLAGTLFPAQLDDSPSQFGAAAIAMGILWWVAFATVRALSRRAVWTSIGDLAERADAARRDLVGRVSLEAIATAVLVPFRLEEDDPADVLAIHALEPPLRIRLEVGDRPHVRSGELPSVYTRAAFDLLTSVLDLVTLRARIVREPGIRELVESMEEAGIGVIVRCGYLDQIEGLLMLPLGPRSEPLTVAEVAALSQLGEVLGGSLASALAQRRAESHIQELSSLRRDAEDRISLLEGELTQLRGQQDVLGRRLAEDDSLHVAYSPSMRRVQTRAIELASVADPVWMVAPSGSSTLPLARFIHDRGSRWEAPFVMGDCGAATPEVISELLFGTDRPGQRGWIRAAATGTLFLRDLPSLDSTTQSQVAHWLAAAHAVDPPSVRVIGTSRLALHELRRRGVLSPKLAACFGESEISLPSLRERREDLPSLVLFAIDRACRVLARPTIGIDQEALDTLVSHDWPGDLAELDFVLEFAVSRARGNLIAPSDLPPLAWPGQLEEAALDGTYAEVEKRLLLRALDRAGGNKSEAARLLGLKRTTFLDKLRRHRLERKRVG